MRAVYFDGQSGASGDMLLGALVDLGADLDAIRTALRPIVPAEFALHVERVSSYEIAAARVTVNVEESARHRRLADVESLLDAGSLSAPVRTQATAIFRRLADAEARIHSTTADKVHFHEVGANDAVIDIVGSLLALELLGVDRVYCAPLVLGSGVGRSAHGPIQFPAPAVLELLKDIPVRLVADLGETTTPTAAAILAEVAEFRTELVLRAERIGYGAGQKTFADRPNLLRATRGFVDASFEHDSLWLAASDIDNTYPEIFEWVAEKLREAGAVDVVTFPLMMKKGRIGTRIEALCADDARAAVAAVILRETGSLGVRWQSVHRTKLARRIETIATPWGPIRVKVAETADGARAIPEYDDCRAAASKHALPLVEIIDRVTRLYYDQTPGRTQKRG
jgi:hypothetical protein